MRDRDIEQIVGRTRPSDEELAGADLDGILRRAQRRDVVTRSTRALGAVGAVAVAVVLALAVPSGAPTPTIGPDVLASSTEVTGQEASELIDRAAALASAGVPASQWDALETATARCMTELGLEYETQPYPEIEPQPAARRWDLADRERFNLENWSPPAGWSSVNPGASELDEAAARSYAEALLGDKAVDAPEDMREITSELGTIASVRMSTSGCRAEAMNEVLPDPEGTATLAASIHDLVTQRELAVEADPDAATAYRNWQDCLEREDVGPAVRNDDGDLRTKLEADTRAAIARRCAEQADLISVMVATDHRVSLSLYRDHQPLLERFLDEFDRQT